MAHWYSLHVCGMGTEYRLKETQRHARVHIETSLSNSYCLIMSPKTCGQS